jgi:glycosyltransferase involved in cell wall biosynthesis
MKKVLLVGTLLPTGGGARYVNDLLESTGMYHFVIFNVARPVKRKTIAGTGYKELFNAGIIRAIYGLGITLWHMLIFPWSLVKSGASIVHICGFSYWPFWENAYYIIISRFLGYHVTLHFLGALDLSYESAGKIEKYFIRKVLCFPQKVILLSQKAYQLANTFISSDRLEIIPSNVDTDKFKPNLEKKHDNIEQVKVLFVGGADPIRKGVYDLLEASVIVVSSNPNVRFVISGGENFEEIRKKWHVMGLDNYINYIGWIKEEEKAKIYQGADILALPSHNEGLPYVVIEAMSSGLPIIASSVGGIPEVVTHRENGFIIEIGDSKSLAKYIIELANNSQMRQEMSERNRKKAINNYSKKSALAQIEKTFDQLP